MRSPCGQGAKLGSEPKQAGLGLGLTCSPREAQVMRSLPRSWARAHNLVQTAACLGKCPHCFLGALGRSPSADLGQSGHWHGLGSLATPASVLHQHSAEAQSQGLGGRPPPHTCKLGCDGHTEPLPCPQARVPSASPLAPAGFWGDLNLGEGLTECKLKTSPGTEGPP